MAFTFCKPHRIGSICGDNCEQCGANVKLTDAFGRILLRQPVAILAEATREDWERGVIADGGIPTNSHPYFYFISTD